MENFTLNTIVERAKAAGYKYIEGEYIQTAKNNMVKLHYPNLGFEAIGDNLYRLNVNDYQPRECYIESK